MTPLAPPADAACAGCPPATEGGGFSRRRLLQGAGVLAATAAASSLLPARYAFAADPAAAAGDVLVVLSLRGGFDGLSAVVPAGDPAYPALRPSIGVPASTLLPLDVTFGLHPALAPLKPLWDAGTLAIVQAMGAPDPTRSHFDALREMERAAPGSSAAGGWLGRWLAASGATETFAGVQRGSSLPLSLSGPTPAIAMESPKDFGLSVWEGIRTEFATALGGLQAGLTHPLAAAATTTLSAAATMARVAATPYVPAAGATYDGDEVGVALRDVAQLVKAGVGLRVACLDVGDWDMHKGLGRVDSGWMHDQLTRLGRGLAAFAADTGLAGVTVVTLTEFGRRAGENGSGGVDHGHGTCSFVLGGGIRGGRVYGRWPGLGAAALDQGDLAGTTDYRTVLRELLADRCGAGSSALDAAFPGFSGAAATPLDLARLR